MFNVKRTRKINTSRVLRSIWLNKGISRIEIANSLDLDKSTISNIVSELIKIGAISEIAEGQSGPQGGRKPIFLTINKDFGCVIGFELRPDSYTAVAVNLEGDEVFSKSELISLSGDNLVPRFFDLVDRTKEEMRRTGIPLLGIGVGISGIVNPDTGVIKYSVPLKIPGSFDFIRKISDKLEVPIFIDNDANCCSWGELTFHRSQGLKNFLFALIEFRKHERIDPPCSEIAVGMGFVINAKVHYGENFSAGEFKSILWQEGNSGQFSLTDEEVHRVESDKELFIRFAEELSGHIALFVNSLDLNIIFLGGDIEKHNSDFYQILQEEIQKNWSYPQQIDCSIRFSSLGDKAVAYGAAGMFLDRLFTDREILKGAGGIDLLQPLLAKQKTLR